MSLRTSAHTGVAISSGFRPDSANLWEIPTSAFGPPRNDMVDADSIQSLCCKLDLLGNGGLVKGIFLFTTV